MPLPVLRAKPQAAEALCRQTVPSSSGRAMVRAAMVAVFRLTLLVPVPINRLLNGNVALPKVVEPPDGTRLALIATLLRLLRLRLAVDGPIVAPMVSEPTPGVIVILVPAVSVLRLRPVPLPISSWPAEADELLMPRPP